MDPPARKEKSKVKEPVSRVEKAKQKSAQQELKQRQRAEVRERRTCTPAVCGRGCWNGERSVTGALPASRQNRCLPRFPKGDH